MQNDLRNTNRRARETLPILCAFASGAVLAAAFTHIPGSPSDWAAWVQAIGSIGAILATVIVVQWQNQTARSAEERAARERYKNLLRAATVVGEELCQLLSILSNSLRETGSVPVSFAATSSMIADVTAAVQSLPLTEFRESTGDQIIRIRRVCREVNLLASSSNIVQKTSSEVQRIKFIVDGWHSNIIEASQELTAHRETL